MPVIKIHLEHEEFSAVKRRAGELGITVEALANGALNCSMGHVQEVYCRTRIDRAVSERGGDLPLWSDSARSASFYEGLPDIHQGPGPKGGPLEPKGSPPYPSAASCARPAGGRWHLDQIVCEWRPAPGEKVASNRIAITRRSGTPRGSTSIPSSERSRSPSASRSARPAISRA